MNAASRLLPSLVFSLLAVLAPFAGSRRVCADGWHNPVLQLGSVNDWLRDAQAAVPDLESQLGSSTLRAGNSIEDLKKLTKAGGTKPPPEKAKKPLRAGSLQAKLTPQQQALLARKANDCLQVLAFMKNGNIYPNEFPNFPIEKIPEYRTTAMQLLDLMGPAGTEAVIGQLRGHLLSGFPQQSDVSYHPDYVDSLLAILADAAASGSLSPEDLDRLEQAMQGKKPRDVQVLKNKIDETISKNLDVPSLLTWADATQDRNRKAQILGKLRDKLSNASPAELEQALLKPDLPRKTETAVIRQLEKLLPEQNVLGLLNLMSLDHAQLQKVTEAELRQRRPKYDEVKGDIARLLEFASSDNERVAAFADWQLANAFRQAPISHCLYWIGQEEPRLTSIIWKQLDLRFEAAGEERKAVYAETALTALKLKDITIPTQSACLEFLGRLKHRPAVGPLVEQLPQLPRELWPKIGDALHQITGVDHGPKAGAGVAEVAVAGKRWREWLREQGQ